MPTRNFSEGQFEGTEAISGERQHDVILERGGKIAHACHRGCTIKCSRIYVDDKDGKYVTKGPEYETIWAHGADCGIDDLDAIAQNGSYGRRSGRSIRSRSGATIGVAMEAGDHPVRRRRGSDRSRWRKFGKGTPLGRLDRLGGRGAGQGLRRFENSRRSKANRCPLTTRVPPMGVGVTYATSTMGADHTAGYSIGSNLLGVGGDVDPLKPEGQVDLSRALQIATGAIDAAGLCLFVAFAVLDDQDAMDGITEMLTAFYGRPYSGDDFGALGKQVLRREREFNAAAGFTAADDRLPDFFKNEKLAPHDVTFAVPDEELDEVFNF